MGILRLALGEGTTNMKLLVFACLVAMALADAEPKADATPTTATTAWATTVLDTDSVATDPVLDTTATTARGPLMLSPLPLLRLIPTTDTTATVLTDTVLATTDTDTVLDTVATTVATTARGPLTPSPLPPLMPRLIPTTDTTATD